MIGREFGKRCQSMDMKNVKPVKGINYLQLNHKIKKVLKEKGVEAISIVEAWKRYKWIKKYIKKKPSEGYFVWIKEQIDFPVSTCVYVSEENVTQNMTNLTIIEPGIKAKGLSLCSSTGKVNARHFARGIVIIKENSTFDLLSSHAWHPGDEVDIAYDYILEKNARLTYTFKDLRPPSKGIFKSISFIGKYASAKIKAVIDGINTDITTEDSVILNGKGSSGTVVIRTVGRKNSRIKGITKAIANAEGKGHLDCSGLIVDKNSKMDLIPLLSVNNKKAQLTHEASIGKIADEQLNYLRSRGLTEKQAIELIVSGFLR